jgi:hypothetical protein
MNERAHNNEMHGTPQGYLSCIVAGRTAASMDVNSRSTGARDLNAVLRPKTEEIRTALYSDAGETHVQRRGRGGTVFPKSPAPTGASGRRSAVASGSRPRRDEDPPLRAARNGSGTKIRRQDLLRRRPDEDPASGPLGGGARTKIRRQDFLAAAPGRRSGVESLSPLRRAVESWPRSRRGCRGRGRCCR